IEHKEIIKDCEEQRKYLRTLTDIKSCLEFAFSFAIKLDKKTFVIIDEYDHFANDLIAQGTSLSDKQYKELIWANGVVRDFYETLKTATEYVVDKIFITGITPIMLDDVTSGFNISNNISFELQTNEILGFTENEVEWLIDACGVNREQLKDIDRKFLYNGYLFHPDGKHTLYNSAMVLYFLYHTWKNGKVEQIIDDNLKTDYGRIKTLISQHENKDTLKRLLNGDEIMQAVVRKFSIIKLHDEDNFLSLLFYMGLVTISTNKESRQIIRIPNYSTQMNYWDYIESFIKEERPYNAELPYRVSDIQNFIGKWADENNPKPFFDLIQGNFVNILSNRDLRDFSEKDIKILIMLLIYQSNFYLPISEQENTNGYTDIYLQRRPIYHDVPYEWVVELKYINQEDAKKETLVERKKSEAIEQLKRYRQSIRYKEKTDIRYLAIVFMGKKDYWMEEVR
ncbi:MAG: ATP-binding protein, partial [Bacteroidales bacterium]|nr:ATP-binding protein [Bacteroidales bacterium]